MLIEAIVVFEEVQVTDAVRFCVELSVYAPVAANCSLVPFAIVGLAGVIVIDTSVAGDTVRSVEPDTLPRVAEIVVDPTPAEVARPEEPDALLIEAVAVLEEPQVTAAVTFCVE